MMMMKYKSEKVEVARLRCLFYYEDGFLFNRISRHKNPVGKKISNRLNSDGYQLFQAEGRYYKAHRVIYAFHHGFFPPEVDHINGIREDNRIENLRACTHKENSRNIVQKMGVSGVQGVSKYGDRWRARLCVDGKRISLGLYDCLELAEFVVSEARDKYHGAFSVMHRI